jgi:hypothetical protein
MNKNSSFSVPDVMDEQVESFPNSITGQERGTRVLLLEGFVCNFGGHGQRCLLFISEIHGLVICWLKFGLTKKKKKSQVGITGLPFSISIVLTNRRINNGQ